MLEQYSMPCPRQQDGCLQDRFGKGVLGVVVTEQHLFVAAAAQHLFVHVRSSRWFASTCAWGICPLNCK